MNQSEKTSLHWIGGLVRKSSGWRIAALIGCLLVAMVAFGLLYISWFRWIPSLFQWGFVSFTLDIHAVGKLLASAIGIFFLAFLPIGVVTWPFQWIGFLLSIYAKEQEDKDRNKIKKVEGLDQKLEDEILKEEDDEHMRSLIRLVRFSKQQLNQYYDTATHQMRRSFLYSTFAMWAGFLIILLVIFQYLAPKSWELPTPPGGVNYLLTAAGVLIEVVSALFFWVYRTAKAEERYFYARRIYLHSVLLGFRVSQSMQESGDLAKQKIVEHLLGETLEGKPGPELPSGVKLAKLATSATGK